MLEGGRQMLEGGREITELQKKGSKGVKIEKSFLVPYTAHMGLPKSEKKVFLVYNHFKVSDYSCIRRPILITRSLGSPLIK